MFFAIAHLAEFSSQTKGGLTQANICHAPMVFLQLLSRTKERPRVSRVRFQKERSIKVLHFITTKKTNTSGLRLLHHMVYKFRLLNFGCGFWPTFHNRSEKNAKKTLHDLQTWTWMFVTSKLTSVHFGFQSTEHPLNLDRSYHFFWNLTTKWRNKSELELNMIHWLKRNCIFTSSELWESQRCQRLEGPMVVNL